MMYAFNAVRAVLRASAATAVLGASCLLSFQPSSAQADAAKVPLPFVGSADGARWDEPDFSYSIPAIDSGWTVKPETYNEASGDLRVVREVVSFSANGDNTRIELSVWDKKRKDSLREWYNGLGKELAGTIGVTEKKITTPAGDNAIWVNVESTDQAPQAELFFIASRDHAYCIRYINKDGGANREAYKQLCLGFQPRLSADAKGAATSIAAPAASVSDKVASCGGVVDACNCGGNNPYPCCGNGSNCTWGAWDRMCCNWGYASRNWGNAETWDNYARTDGLWVQSTPTVGSVACRNVHSDTPYGHVAYVLQISGSSVYVIQMNCNVGGAGWSYQWFPTSWFTGGYITRTNPTPTPTVFVVDNTSAGFAASTAWATATSAADKYGTNYRYKSTAAISDAASWTVNIPTAANYTIAAWWCAGANRSATAPYIMPNGTTVHKNQQGNGGSWQNLGTQWLGTGNQTTKLSCWTTTGFVVIADAVRYTRN